MEHTVGTNRRIFPTGFISEDIDHVKPEAKLARGYIATEGLLGPNSLFEHNMLDNLYPKTRELTYEYELRQPGTLGKTPEIVQTLIDEQLPFGLLELQKSLFPHNLYEMQQKQFELYDGVPELGDAVMINGKVYSTTGIADRILKKEEKMKKEPPPDEMPDE